jgi:hypothetical protein
MHSVFICCPLLLEVPFLELLLEELSIQPNSLQVLDRIISGIEKFGFRNEGWIESPLKGAEGNIEFLACFERISMPEAGAEAVTQADAQVEAEAVTQVDAQTEAEAVTQADAQAEAEAEKK